MKITNFAVKNYQFTLIIFVLVAVVGLLTLFTMPRSEDPTTHPPQYLVTVIYPGTSPKDMEEQVVKPIENKIYGLENIDKILTTVEDGVAAIQIKFKYGVDVDNKYQEISTEINALKNGELPKDIYQIKTEKIASSDVKIIQVALISNTASSKTLRDNADKLKTQLEKITNLREVKYTGMPEQEIRIDMQLDKLAQLKIPLNLVIGSLQSEAADIPGGSINIDSKVFNVKTSGKFKDVKDVANTIIYNSNGKIIYLKDVAHVSYMDGTINHITRINGQRCILVTSSMKNNVDISQVKKEYTPVLEQFSQTLPQNIKMVKNFDQADMVSKRLGHLGFDFGLAILLVVVTLLPLGFRPSLIVMISIPLSLALGLIAMNLLGFSLNQLSIVGLVVALGLLVDDSIVVVENIERWLREGHSRKDAILKGTKQIGAAVVGCTATLVIAFLPLAFLPDMAGEFIRSLPMAIITSVLASMIVALTLVPFIGSKILKTHTHGEGNYFLKKLQGFLTWSYRGIMPLALKWPKATISISIALSVLAFLLFPLAGFKLFPTSEKPMFLINIKMPLQANIPESDSAAKLVEMELKKHKEIVYYTSNVGKGNPQIYYNVHQQDIKPDFAQIFVQLEEETSPNDKTELIKTLRSKFTDFPYAKIEVKDFEQGTPIEANIVVRVFGENQDTLRSLSFKVEELLRKHPGTFFINNELNAYKSDVKIKIDKAKARTLGVLTSDIDKVIRLAVAGLTVGDYIDDRGDSRNVVITIPRNKFSNLNALKNLYVNNIQGAPIQIDQIATIGLETSPTAINHFNKSRFAKVTSLTKDNVLANDILKDIVPELNKLKMPKGYYYKLSGEAESEGDALGGNFLSVIILSTFLFIAVLLLQFKTFKGIIIVLSIIPLGVLGGVIFLLMTGNPMSLVSIIGFIGLSGIQVKNSLLLVDFTNQLREDGKSIDEAIHIAGETRFLPVVLTSITAICGLIPIAMNPNPQIAPLAIVLIGGLISSTILSRIVTPVMYKLIPPQLHEKI
ncbi:MULTISPECIES: efflux RND transporter permease subunit [unclassified Pedobacter]|uniref:efflux RND transporter permease subunit n=1 Tax=unclassified Pedobacter TaxID=2628915 RepID=UPI001DD9081E|nr:MULTISPECIES: efflux RND transporter permease subunit [unclassified Pedobacter]CAH0149876.1 Cobalt-zinc-cadmium resistance protein CzcA [Pedobacter sp. Bi126]CAH0208400.1 Cobalt-zinc-cadmium resistance protein CzcA [Pedobacter sp. Bi36]